MSHTSSPLFTVFRKKTSKKYRGRTTITKWLLLSERMFLLGSVLLGVPRPSWFWHHRQLLYSSLMCSSQIPTLLTNETSVSEPSYLLWLPGLSCMTGLQWSCQMCRADVVRLPQMATPLSTCFNPFGGHCEDLKNVFCTVDLLMPSSSSHYNCMWTHTHTHLTQ